MVTAVGWLTLLLATSFASRIPLKIISMSSTRYTGLSGVRRGQSRVSDAEKERGRVRAEPRQHGGRGGPVVMWFRRDLRVEDNRALVKAAE
eukprot:943853-Amorphochlora_amoeboformis.AAC.1